MKCEKLNTWIIFILLIIFSTNSVNFASASFDKPQNDFEVYFPLVSGAQTTPLDQAIIADHRHTDVSQIPDYWIEQAKLLVVHYAHTSHGGQVLSGLRWLESRDSKYNVDIQASGTVVLPGDTTALRIYDGNNYPGNTYITPNMYS
jgi:hypothetical protein